MYQIFTKRYEVSGSIISPPGFELIQRTLENSISKITNYFRSRVFAVKSNHLLCRILDTGLVPTSYSDERFLQALYARSIYVSKYYNLTSSVNYGKMFKGVFYNGCDEIILYTEEYYNPDILEDWKNIQAVRVLDHPVSNMGLLLPDGNINNSESGLAVIEINIPLLISQYRCFLNSRLVDDNNSLLGVTHFVHMFVLPNMLYSHIELVILNRLMNLFYGAPMGEALKHLPFPVIDYSNKTDVVLTIVKNRLKSMNSNYPTMLMNIPSVYSSDMEVGLTMPDIALTRQAWWALLLSRLRAMEFLIDISSKAIGNNKSLINTLKIDVKRLSRDNPIQTIIPKDMYYDIMQTFTKILRL